MNNEINLIEGERGKLHVTSDDARTENALMFGIGRKVLNMDNSFEATMTNRNTVRITSGVFYNNGMFIRIDRDTYMDVIIENGLPGTFRNDLICIRYARDIQTQLETASLVVKKGTASETAATDPAYTVGDVLEFENLDEFPLYRVSLNGVMPTLEPMFVVEDALDNISIYKELIEHIRDDENPHDVSKEQLNIENVDNTSDMNKPVSTAQQKAIDTALISAKSYTNSQISDLINGAPKTLDTLKEIADVMVENEDIVTVLENSVVTNTKNIDALSKEQDEFATQLDVLNKNVESNAEGVSGRVAGKNPTAQNTTPAPLIYGKFKGYTEQRQYSGKNKFDKSILADVDTTGNTTKFAYIQLKPNTYYTMSSNEPITSATDVFFLGGYVNNGDSGSTANNGVYLNNPKTMQSDANGYVTVAYRSLYQNTLSDYEWQIEEGTTATPYEPYVGGTASPNPDYPQEINGLAKGGAIEVKTCGKNLINDSAVIGKKGIIDTYHKVELEPNKTYYFVAKTTSGDGMARGYFGAYLLDKDGKFVVSYINQTGKYASEFTLTEEQANSIVNCRITANGTQPSDMLVTEIAISETPEYEPYTETTATIPTDAPLYEGDYLAVYADGSGKLVRKMGVSDSLVLSSENQNVMTLTKEVRYKKPTDMTDDSTTPFYSDIGRWVQNTYNRDEVGICGYTYGETVGFRVPIDTDVSTLAPIIVYPLATPTETPLTVQQVAEFKKLYTFENVTNVFCDGEVEIQFYKNNGNGGAVGKLQGQVDVIKSSVANNLTTTEEGFVLDARLGKYLNDKINSTRVPNILGGDWSRDDITPGINPTNIKTASVDGIGVAQGVYISRITVTLASANSGKCSILMRVASDTDIYYKKVLGCQLLSENVFETSTDNVSDIKLEVLNNKLRIEYCTNTSDLVTLDLLCMIFVEEQWKDE